MAQDILGYFGRMSWPRIFWDTLGECHGLGYFGILWANVMSQDILGYFWQYHGLGYFGILLAMSCPRIFWDTFGNIMAQDILGYFWQYQSLGYFGTSMVQGYKRRQSGEQPFSRLTLVDGSIKLVLFCNSPLVCSRSITHGKVELSTILQLDYILLKIIFLQLTPVSGQCRTLTKLVDMTIHLRCHPIHIDFF